MLKSKTILRSLLTMFFIGQTALANAQQRPNVLLIIGDDQGYADIGATGLASDVNTPNLDALAKTGVRFTQAYVAAPICNVSRTSLITGSYPQRFSGYWYGGSGLENAKFATLAEVMQSQGYQTGYIGKYHYGRNLSTNNRNFPLRHGFDSLYGFAGGRKHYMIHNAEQETNFKQRIKQASKKSGKNLGSAKALKMEPMWVNDQQVDQQGFSTELFGEQAQKYLTDYSSHVKTVNAEDQQPFFLQVSFNAIHNFTHQLPEKYLKDNGLTARQDWQPEKESFMQWYKSTMYPNNPQGREYYLAQLSYLDNEVGKIITTLKAQGLAENTLVVYISDNGGSTSIYANNGPLNGSKYTLYEGGLRVPMIVNWPQKYPTAKVLDNVVSAMDLYPTILQAADIAVPTHIDGQDLSPLLSGAKPNLSHDILFWDTGHAVGVRAGKWKYRFAKSDQYANRQQVKIELGEFLYNLDNDPGEKNNLIKDFPEVVQELKRKYLEWAKNNIKGSSL
ncbi:sulfatase-like hydrolase/transferase [Thalassotalea fonticola]|uniref:Sulfatase-like hydrolase/transferase n=1 Tax=Thalassotalea fonticola TaxID=3065649 RepID=A0ABZ0GLF9_9GAMM|nr:sulfatase-like hydrolase/transferase [Colwelliaceae bacterium S1-1]